MKRLEGRVKSDLRKINITPGFMKYAEGSCLFEIGNTKVVCSASVEEGVPPFLKGKGTGWVTAEYGMLPRSCQTRIVREASRGKLGGRTQEIQRLIGRSMRSVTDLSKMGERTIKVDADVIQADGGTRCASITGCFISLALAFKKLKKEGILESIPLSAYVAAVSVGIVDGKEMLDLSYEEDSKASVDMNIVMTEENKFIEIQGTAEGDPFSLDEMQGLVELAKKGLKSIFSIERNFLKLKV